MAAAFAPIVGIILAAGLSRRLGRSKQLLVLGGRPLIHHVVERALASTLDQVMVVTGHEHASVEAAIATLAVKTIFNREFESGQASSLETGVRALPPDADAIVVLLGDQPLVSIPAINGVILQRREHRSTVVMTGYGDTRSHPILLGSELFTELLELQGDQGAREIIRKGSIEIAVTFGTDARSPLDVDTEEAYAHLLHEYESQFNTPGQPEAPGALD